MKLRHDAGVGRHSVLVGAFSVIVKLRVIFAYVRSKLWFWPRMRGEEINGGDIVKNQIF